MKSNNNIVKLIIILIGVILFCGYMLDVPASEPNVYIPAQPTETQALIEILESLSTLIYGSIAASLIAALAAIVCLMQVNLIASR